jgi:hypothetical protein
MIPITSKKYIHAIAVAGSAPPKGEVYVVSINVITTLDFIVKESMTVYTAFTRIMGLIMGNVIFQKVSHADAPSICTDS